MIRRELDILLTAVMFFTRIPVASLVPYTFKPAYLQASSRYFPLLGWLVGGLTGGVYWLAQLWLPIAVAVLLSMAFSICLTGAFHEDGFADVCDGFGGGVSKEQILKIMKDSRLGTYGTVGLFFVLGLKATSLIALSSLGSIPLFLFVAHSLSRLAATSVIFGFSYVDSENSKAKPLATSIGRRSMFIAALFGLVPLGFLSVNVSLLIAVLIVVTLALSLYFVRRIGGYTGDCLGAVQQVTEVSVYLVVLGVS